MANLMLDVVSAPGGLWAIILNWINSSVLNFAWTIIIFTLLVKLILSPLDFLIKFSSKKSNLVQQKCAPQLEKLRKKYGNNSQQVAVQQQALYKKEGLNMFSSCFVTLINLVLTIIVFFSIYTTLREVSAYYAIKQYQELNTAYTNAYEQVLANKGITYDRTADYSSDEAMLTEIANAKQDESVKQAVQQKWDEVKDSWLWISNIWVVDGNAKPLPTYQDLTKLANNAGGMFESGVKQEYVNFVAGIDESYYNEVTSSLTSQINRWNGYYILAILAGVVTFLSTWVSELGNKLKRKKTDKPKTNSFIKSTQQANASQMPDMSSSMKWMKIIMPVIMVIFVISSSAAFGIYIFTQSAVGILLGFLINLLVDKLTYQKQLEVIEFLDKIEKRTK